MKRHSRSIFFSSMNMPPACVFPADRLAGKSLCKRTELVIFGLVLLLFMMWGGNVWAENVSGNITGFVSNSVDSVNFRLEELSVIEYPKEQGLLNGLELHIGIPSEIHQYQHGFAFVLYKNVSPKPHSGNQTYEGTRLFMRLLPSRDSMFLRIPLSNEHNLVGDAITQLLPIHVNKEEFPLIATIIPVSKGIPEKAYTRNFSINSTPLWKDEGFLSVVINNLSGIPEEIITITIDGVAIAPGEQTTLASGLHKVQVSSTHAPLVESSVVIEPGATVNLQISLDYRPPVVTIMFPEGATALLDGEEVDVNTDGVTLEVEPGNHTVTAIIGDNMISRDFSVRPGSKVGIELLLDIKIIEFDNETGNPYGAGDG